VYTILGATGHVGGAAAAALLDEGRAVTVVTRDAARAEPWRRRGADVAVVDVTDIARLREVFRSSSAAFLLNPPGDPSGDSETAELGTAAAIVDALQDCGLERVVVASTFGARRATGLGDLGTLYELEDGVRASGIPAVVNRGAYYYTNWDHAFASSRADGVMVSMIPADLEVPMVSPTDLGRAAARRLIEAEPAIGIHHVEGPRRYTPRDVADAFARHVGAPVAVETIPPEEFRPAFERMGFSPVSADSYAEMTRYLIAGSIEIPEKAERGTTTLEQHVAQLASSGGGS
jgi:uncharacterized protein YbjT (DUF2867 family)